MTKHHYLWAALMAALCVLGGPGISQGAPLQVCATVQDLGDLARVVGGDEVEVTVFAKGVEDPHFVEAKNPASSKHSAALTCSSKSAWNWKRAGRWCCCRMRAMHAFLPGAAGFVDGAKAISPLEVPEGEIDRSHGDVHAEGNPHYLLDPENGLKVAQLIATHLSGIRPERAGYFQARLADYTSRMRKEISNWEAELAPANPGNAVPRRPQPVGVLREPVRPGKRRLPGAQTRRATHDQDLQAVMQMVKARDVKLLFSSPFFDTRHGRFVAGISDIHILPLAHQVGARPGTDTYEQMIGYNVRTILAALKP